MRRATVTLGLLAILASLLCAAPAFAGKPKEGWGATGSFIGRYHVKVLVAGGSGVRGGELSLLIQEELPGSEEPAGILKLRTKTNNDVVYLKELTHKGRERGAVVKGGAFVGPTIGKFIGKLRKPGRLAANISTRGLGTFELVFSRYSKKPTP